MKKLFLVLSVLFLFFPTIVLSANSINPEFNPICWKEEDCIELRKRYGASDTDAKDGFLPLESPCNKEGYGKCLPAGVIKTQIKFGGQSKFSDIGQFLLVNYNYLIGIAAILAVIMIIVAGIQWTTSGGNSDTISRAKKRISGALVGLILVYGSYAILNTINPALVNLRLPQTFMTRSTPLSFKYCDQSPSSTVFAYAGPTEKQLTKDDFLKVTDFPLTMADKEKLVCGQQFYVGGANGATCLGNFCKSSGSPQICAKDFNQPNTNRYVCRKGIIAGTVTHNSLIKDILPDIITEEWDDPPIDDNETELWAVCVNGDTTDVGRGDYGGTVDDKNQFYIIDANLNDLEAAAKRCEDKYGGLKGFVLMFEMNESNDSTDEEHLVGIDGGNAKDLGDESFFDKYVRKINNKYFIQLDQIRGGMILDVEAANIIDVDDASEKGDWKHYMKLLE